MPRRLVSWTAPAAGTDQLVIIGGQTAPSERRDGRVLVDSHVATGATTNYDVFYSTRQAQSNTLDVTSTAVTFAADGPPPRSPAQPAITAAPNNIFEIVFIISASPLGYRHGRTLGAGVAPNGG